MNKHLTINHEEAFERFQDTVSLYQQFHQLTSAVCTMLIHEGRRLQGQLTPEHQLELEVTLAFLEDLREELASQPAA